MINFVLVGGYKCVGKTSLLRNMENFGFKTYSTSGLIHEIAQSLYKISVGEDLNTADKSITNVSIFGKTFPIMRDYLIFVAENMIVNNFGRRGLIDALLDRPFVRDVQDIANVENDIIFLETIGGAESIHMMNSIVERMGTNLEHGFDYQIILINLVDKDIKAGGDIRELLKHHSYPVFDIHREKTSKLTAKKVLNCVKNCTK